MDNDSSGQYLLVTPVKNEEKYLPGLILSIINQSIKPALWVIVDDKSTDRTPDIIKEAKEKHRWIQSIQLEESVRDRGVHLANVIKTGFDSAFKYCEENGINFDYLGNVDADVVPDNTYFEKLMDKFTEDEKLGVASGGEWIVEENKTTYYKGHYPAGGDVLYRRKCFENCGGVPLSDLWDSVLNTKAELRGWKLARFDDSRAFIKRGYSRVDGLWSGYKKFGQSSYSLDYNFFYAVAKGLKLLFEKPHYFGLAYLYGYLGSIVSRKNKINDKEIKYYYRYTRPKEINQYYINILKNRLRLK